MKLRCAENSLRLRVRKSDVEQLQKQGSVQEIVRFGVDQVLQYQLLISDIKELSATFENGLILVQIPEKEAQRWINSEQVGLEGKGDLHILIEKDFPCRHTSTDDKEDTYYELVPPEDKIS